jgi:hypothetical protein
MSRRVQYKKGIFRAYNFFSEAKGTEEWHRISANLEQEMPCPGISLLLQVMRSRL